EGVAVADDEPRSEADGRRLARAPVRCDHERRTVLVRSDQVAQLGVVRGDVPIGDDDGGDQMMTSTETGRRRCLDSLRWYDPDQVPRVCGPLPALSAPGGAPLSRFFGSRTVRVAAIVHSGPCPSTPPIGASLKLPSARASRSTSSPSGVRPQPPKRPPPRSGPTSARSSSPSCGWPTATR